MLLPDFCPDQYAHENAHIADIVGERGKQNSKYMLKSVASRQLCATLRGRAVPDILKHFRRFQDTASGIFGRGRKEKGSVRERERVSIRLRQRRRRRRSNVMPAVWWHVCECVCKALCQELSPTASSSSSA